MKKRFSKNFIISVIFGFCSFVCMFTASAEDTFETIEKAKDTVKGIADTAVQRCDISKAAKKSTATEQEKKAYELLKNLYNIFEDVPHRDSGKLFYVVPNNNTGCETDKYTYSLKALDKRPCHDNMSFDTLSNINSRDSNKRYRQNAQYYCKVSTGTIINTAMIQEIGRASYGEDFERGSYELDDSSTKIGSQRSMQGGGENGTVVVYYKLDQGYQNGKYVKGLMVNRPFRANENENRQMNAMDAQQRKNT